MKSNDTTNAAGVSSKYTHDPHTSSGTHKGGGSVRSSLKDWTYKKLHGWDIYAKPITLTFNKKPAFATVPGGLCSIVTIICFNLVLIANSIVYFTDSNHHDSTKTEIQRYMDQMGYSVNTSQINLMY